VPPKKIWKLKPPSSLSPRLALEAGSTPLQAQLLINRGISDPSEAKSFLHPRLDQMADPMLLKDMDHALDLILGIIENGKEITIYGDYDADGLTATALLNNFLKDIGVPASFHIPDRIKDGYGLNKEALEKIAGSGTSLLITVDCGTSSSDQIDFAKRLGMEVVVTDHHRVPPGHETNWPFVNPNRPDCTFPFKGLSGVGLAFFLAVALRSALRERGWFEDRHEPDLREYLDLVALGTVADRAPLLNQNRILVNTGIKRMSGSRWPGIKAIVAVSALATRELSADDLAFRLAPRLNAPGRMGNPGIAMGMLTAETPNLAGELALKINKENNLRQDVQKEILEQIENMLETMDGLQALRTLVIAGQDWHKGVLGIVASRLVDKYHRTALVLSIQDGIATGSGRSIKGFDLYHALGRIGHVFERFGGHAHAAGFALKANKLEILKTGLEEIARETMEEKDMVPVVDVDAEIPLDRITYEMISEIKALSPFGEGNPEPVFLARSLEVLGSGIVGKRHLKLRVRQEKMSFEAIGFGLSYKHPLKGKTMDMIFKPGLNRWQGHETIQLKIVDLRST